MDTLSLLLTRFTIRAGVFYTGHICGLHSFEGDEERGHLHIIEHGPVDLRGEDGSCRRIEKPTLLFLPRPHEHSIVADDVHGAKVICATVQFGGGNNNPISNSLPSLLAIEFEQLDGAAWLLALIRQEAFAAEEGSQASVNCLCELLMVRLLRHCLAQGLTSGGTLAALSDPRLAKAIAAIHLRPGHGWDLEEMASEAGLSRARFAARFREVTGETPADHLAGWRITVAQNLLKSGRAMKQVCAESGYGSSSAFIRAFVRKVGMPPSRWLRQLEGGPAPSPHNPKETLDADKPRAPRRAPVRRQRDPAGPGAPETEGR